MADVDLSSLTRTELALLNELEPKWGYQEVPEVYVEAGLELASKGYLYDWDSTLKRGRSRARLTKAGMAAVRHAKEVYKVMDGLVESTFGPATRLKNKLLK